MRDLSYFLIWLLPDSFYAIRIAMEPISVVKVRDDQPENKSTHRQKIVITISFL
jgi:hypothetical protein